MIALLKNQFLSGGIFFAVTMLSCAGAPSFQKLEVARQALDSARSAGAETYASREYTLAQDHYWVAMNAISDAKRSLYNVKKYLRKANAHLDSVVLLAARASASARLEYNRAQEQQSSRVPDKGDAPPE